MMPSPSRSLPDTASLVSTIPGADAAQRQRLLESAIRRWLRVSGMAEPAASAASLELAPAALRWLETARGAGPADAIGTLGERLALLAEPHVVSAPAFLGAFARSLVEQAVDEVAREARRAGHAEVFEGLRPWLYTEPPPQALAALGERLGFSASALAIARSRLRQRLRQRLESGLRAWSPEAETRKILRRQLRASMIAPETTP